MRSYDDWKSSPTYDEPTLRECRTCQNEYTPVPNELAEMYLEEKRQHQECAEDLQRANDTVDELDKDPYDVERLHEAFRDAGLVCGPLHSQLTGWHTFLEELVKGLQL